LTLVLSGFHNDFFVYNPHNSEWTDISDVVSGERPVEKFGCGVTVQGGKLFVFGGYNHAGITFFQV
jgi:N-acetylneuraminic acid mutarotase